MGSTIGAHFQLMSGSRSLPASPRSRSRPLGIGNNNVLDPAICWRAIHSRDPRFDGRFFVGATTSGLYCRNVCPVPAARPANILLFASATAADLAGFRPCKRCQPQAVPGTPAWLGTSAVVSRAFRLILEGALNERSIEKLAARLGFGSRQLRRLFVQHLGTSPLKIATALRVNQARRLIDESKIPMTEIAFRSGFNSVREFNHSVRLSSGKSPTELRQNAGGSTHSTSQIPLELCLPYREPFNWDSMIAFLKPRAIPGVEMVTGNTYQRTIEIGGGIGCLTISPDEKKPRLRVRLSASSYEGLAETVAQIRRVFDLNADPSRITTCLDGNPTLRRLIKMHPGLRVPGAWDGFEAAVLAILGQKLTSPGPKSAAIRLVQMFGTPVSTPIHSLNYLFPQPKALEYADLSMAGMSDACADAIRKLSISVVRGQFSFAVSATLDEVVCQMGDICGIDSSTANYIAMRAFGEPDAFPSRDSELCLRLAITGSNVALSQALAMAERWRPWRSYAAMYLAQ
jgi:AraC family transcriptional regulator, regulatory protein of adaptative response / DNA-3-methyladenine glycosylase II